MLDLIVLLCNCHFFDLQHECAHHDAKYRLRPEPRHTEVFVADIHCDELMVTV